MNSNNIRLAKNTIYLYTRMIITLIISFITVRIVLNSLGVTDYGIYNVIIGFVSIFSVLNTTLSTGINRFFNIEIGKRNNEGISEVYKSALAIQLCLAILLIILFETIGLWYFDNVLIIPEDRVKSAFLIFQFATISIIFQVLQVPYTAAIIAYEKINYFAIINIIDAFIKLAIALLIRWTDKDKLVFYGFFIMLISIFNFIMYFTYCKIKLKNIKLKYAKFNKENFKSMLSFSGYYLFNVFAFTMRSQGNNLLLNYFFGPIINAAYAIANQIYMAIENVGANLITACKPQIIQEYSSGNYHRVKMLLFRMTKFTFILNLVICLIAYFELPYLLNIWLGNDYPDISVTFGRIIILVNIISSFAPLLNVTICAVGKIKKFMIISSFIILSSLLLSYIGLIFEFPSYVVLISILIVTFIQSIASIMLVNKEFNYIKTTEYLKKVYVPCILTLLLSIPIPIIIINIMPSSILRLFITIICIIIECIILAYKIILDKEEQLMIINIINQNVRKKSKNDKQIYKI